MDNNSQSTFSCPAIFHCQSGRRAMSTTATTVMASEPRITTKYKTTRATMPAPVHSVSHSGRLNAAVDGVYFPYWEDHFGWRSTGTRTDHVDGRAVTTVFYQDSAGRRVGYAIVAGTPSPRMSGGTVALRGGVPYRMITVNGVHVICWMRNGHLCVVGARGVSSATLLKLASWSGEGAVAS